MKRVEAGTNGTESLPELFVKLGDDLSAFVDTKVELLKVEVREDVSEYLRGGLMIAAGIVVALVGFALLNVALAFGISLLFESTGLSQPARYGIGFLVAAIIYLIVGGAVILISKNRLAKRDPLPERSIRELKKDRDRLSKEL